MSWAQPGAIDATFNSSDIGFSFGDGVDGFTYVRSSVMQPDGKVVIGGSFTSYNGIPCSRIARLNADGSLDASFDPGTGPSSEPWDIALQSDGKILIVGEFTSYNGKGRNRITRLNTDGSLDTGYFPGTGANFMVWSIVVHSDDKAVIGGSFTSYNEISCNFIARLNTDGSLDTSFNPGTGADLGVESVALQSDDKVLIGGFFTSYNGTARNRIARLNADGSLDTSFDPGSGAEDTRLVPVISNMALQSDGKVLISGNFDTYDGTAREGFARLLADGSLDTGFDYGTGAGAEMAILPQPDGKVIITGSFSHINGTPRELIARLNADGSLDLGFVNDPFLGDGINCMLLQPDGKVLVGGGSPGSMARQETTSTV